MSQLGQHLVLESPPEKPDDPDSYRQPTVIETLVRLAGPKFTDSPDRTNLIEMSHHWRLHLIASPFRPASLPLLKSPLPDASDEQWTRLVATMATGESGGISPSGLGLFEMPPQRLKELGFMDRAGGPDAGLAMDPNEDGGDNVIFGAMEPSEIAWASILLGNFPDLLDLRRGVTVAEVIDKETRAIREARRRADAGLKARCQQQDE